MNIALKLSILSVLVVLLPKHSAACSCVTLADVSVRSLAQKTKQNYKQAEAVFIAHVESITPKKKGSSGVNEYSVRLSVRQVFKGKVQDTVVSETGSGWGDCTFGRMYENRDYVIYASSTSQRGGSVDFGLCGGTHVFPDESSSASFRDKHAKELATLAKLRR